MGHYLAGCWLKLDRAKEHLQSLDDEVIADFSGREPGNRISIVLDPHPEASEYRLRIERLPNAPTQRWGIVVGDIAHNLRSALDHLAWQLVATGDDRTPKRPDWVTFPISSSRDFFRGALNKPVLPGVRWRQRALVYRFQPCKRYHRHQSSPLWWLRELSDLDKHRVIAPLGFALDSLPLTPTLHDLEIVGIEPNFWVPFEPDAIIAVIHVRVTGTNPQMSVDGDLPFYVAFQQGERAGTSLGLMLGSVQRVLEAFQPFFDSLPCTETL